MTVYPELNSVADVAGLNVAERKTPCCIVIPVSNCGEFESNVIDSGIAKQLVVSGCRMFVLTGVDSELAHDILDEVLVQLDAESVLTTYHEDDEPVEDVAALVDTMAKANGIKEIIVVLDDSGVHRTMTKELELLFSTGQN